MSIDNVHIAQSAAPAAALPAAGTQTASAQAGNAASGSEHHHFSFHDVLDTINPLQHLPVISTIYRHLTGDTIGNTARVVGDTIYGGPIGLVAGLIDAHMVNSNGKDMGDRVLAMVDGDDDTPAKTATAQMASAAPADAAAALPGQNGAGQITPSNVNPGSTGGIGQSVTLSALPSKPQPMILPHLPPAGSYGMPAQTAPGNAASGNVAAQLAALSVPGTPTTAPSSLPSMGSPATAAALAEAAPITPQTVQLQGLVPATAGTAPQNGPPLTAQAPLPMVGAHNGFAIDTSPQGIMAMHAHAQSHAPVQLQLSTGLLPSSTAAVGAAAAAQKSAATGTGNNAPKLPPGDFVARMKQGLEKYQAMMRQQNAAANGGTVTGPNTPGSDAHALAASLGAQLASLPVAGAKPKAAVAQP